MTTETKLQLGQSIVFTKQLTQFKDRLHVRRGVRPPWGTHPKFNEIHQDTGHKLSHQVLEWEHEPMEGVVIGVTSLSEGYMMYHGWDGPASFHATKRVKAYEVKQDLNGPIILIPFGES